MNHLFLFQPGASLAGDVLWQSGLFLTAGVVISFGLSGRPARAHRVLLLAMVGALVSPLFSQLARREGWGFLSNSEPDFPSVLTTSTAAISSDFDSRSGTVQPISPVQAHASRAGSEHHSAADQPTTRISTRDALVGLWCVLSGLSLLRLFGSLVLGRRIISGARLIACESIERAIEVACTRLGLRMRPLLRASSHVACPAIWCWGRHPVIILPESSDLMAAQVDWVGVFCHELAHWLRRDHWSSLFGDLLVCALPWHPLAWLAKHRLGQLSELACDDWAIASGQEPAVYAESLLELAPRRRMTTALAAVSRRSGLAGRVAHILATEGPVEPRAGGRFSGVVALSVIGLVTLMALAQAREGGVQSDAMKKNPSQTKSVAAPGPRRDQATHRVIRGSVRDTSGRPIGGASIFAAGEKILARASSDGDGHFTLDLPIDPTLMRVDIVAKAPGMGLTGRNFSIQSDGQGEMRFQVLSDQPVDMTLAAEVPIEGRLLAPGGAPISGATVSLTALSLGVKPDRDWVYLNGPHDDRTRQASGSYWSGPVVTDKEGRFQLAGLSAKARADLTIVHPDYVHESLAITTEKELDSWHKQWAIMPIAPRFTHVLEPSRPIEGVVVDGDTGRPIAGVNLNMYVARAPDWRFHFHATTDAEGRYRITGVRWNQPQSLVTDLSPQANSGFLAAQDRREEWPIGASELRWNFSLKKGQMVTGKVIDADTKQPIAGAEVAGESHVLTDKDGKFALPVLPGTRSLFVDGPTADYERRAIPRSETGNLYTYYPHGYTRIHVPAEGKVAPVEIMLKKGATIVAQTVDPDGKVLSNVWASGLPLYARLNLPGQTAAHYSNGRFRMSSFGSGQTYRIFFIQNDHHLAGFADLTARAKPTEPVKVTLRPTAAVHGKLIKPDGSPRSGAGVQVNLLMSPDEPKLNAMEFLAMDRVMLYGLASQHSGDTGTDEKGLFQVGDLMAGVKLYLVFLNTGDRVEYIPIDPLQPGEVRDLGLIKPIVRTGSQS
jgi:beta-lactamase regulating signal transducer with metallopeptidase domain